MTEIVAIAVWGDRISPVFDSSKSLLILNTAGQTITERKKIELHSESPTERALEISGAHVQTLICGAISSAYEKAISESGIRLYSFIAGDAEHVIESYLRGESLFTAFHMPGCGHRHQRRRNRRARQTERRM